jgi:hypothetical protein
MKKIISFQKLYFILILPIFIAVNGCNEKPKIVKCNSCTENGENGQEIKYTISGSDYFIKIYKYSTGLGQSYYATFNKSNDDINMIKNTLFKGTNLENLADDSINLISLIVNSNCNTTNKVGLNDIFGLIIYKQNENLFEIKSFKRFGSNFNFLENLSGESNQIKPAEINEIGFNLANAIPNYTSINFLNIKTIKPQLKGNLKKSFSTLTNKLWGKKTRKPIESCGGPCHNKSIFAHCVGHIGPNTWDPSDIIYICENSTECGAEKMFISLAQDAIDIQEISSTINLLWNFKENFLANSTYGQQLISDYYLISAKYNFTTIENARQLRNLLNDKILPIITKLLINDNSVDSEILFNDETAEALKLYVLNVRNSINDSISIQKLDEILLKIEFLKNKTVLNVKSEFN